MDGETADQANEFMKQFSGSAAANVVTVVLLGCLMLLKKLCDRPSRCKSHIHCPCLDVEVMDREKTRRSKPPVTAAETGPQSV